MIANGKPAGRVVQGRPGHDDLAARRADGAVPRVLRRRRLHRRARARRTAARGTSACPSGCRATHRALRDEAAEALAGAAGVARGRARRDYPFSTTGGVATSLDPGFALENQTRPTYQPAASTPPPSCTSSRTSGSATRWPSRAGRTSGSTRARRPSWRSTTRRTHGGLTGRQWLRDQYDGIASGNDFWDHEVADPCPSHDGCVSSIFAWWVYNRGAMALQALRNLIDHDKVYFNDPAATGSPRTRAATARRRSSRRSPRTSAAWTWTTSSTPGCTRRRSPRTPRRTASTNPAGERPPWRPRWAAGSATPRRRRGSSRAARC